MTIPAPFRPGLDGIVAAQTAISEIDGEHGTLIYHGYRIQDLAERVSYEEAAHLLWYGHLPTTSELDALKQKLASQRELPAPVLATIRAMPPSSEPMDVLRTAVSALGTALNMQGMPTMEHSLALTARFPTILASFQRLRNGRLFTNLQM